MSHDISSQPANSFPSQIYEKNRRQENRNCEKSRKSARHPLSTFKINTCKSVSKQRTLSPCRMNTYEKPRGRGHQLPAIFAPLVYPDLRGATRLPRSSRGHASLPPSYAPYASRMDLRDAPRSASIPRGLSRLRILPVTTGVDPTSGPFLISPVGAISTRCALCLCGKNFRLDFTRQKKYCSTAKRTYHPQLPSLEARS